MFANIVSESVQVIKEAFVAGEREEDLLLYKNVHADLEVLIQSVLSSLHLLWKMLL